MPAPSSSHRDLDPRLASTWQACAATIHECLVRNDVAGARAIVEACVASSWLGVMDSDFHPLAAATLVRAGEPERALALVREARRFGFPRFWYFDAAWGSHGIDQASTFALHRLLRPLYDDAAIAAFVLENFSAAIEPIFGGGDLRKTPLAWCERAKAGKAAKCALSGRVLEAGAEVFQMRLFNGSFDIPTDFVVAATSAFDADVAAMANRRKFETDGYALADFAFKTGYDLPQVNAFWFDHERSSLDDALSIVTESFVSPTPWALTELDGDARPASPTRGRDREVFAGDAGELVDLLWVMVKCGSLPEILRRLPTLPRDFGVLLLLFDRSELRRAVAAQLGAPELVSIYELLSRPRLAAKDKAALVQFGREHPAFQELLAASLARYEYHLYSNYDCSPNWFFQDFRHLVRGRGRHFLYLLASRPALLPPLAAMRAARQSIGRPNLEVTGIAYDDICKTMLEVLLVNARIDDAPDAQAWRELVTPTQTQTDSETDAPDLVAALKAANDVARHLGVAPPARKRARRVAEPEETPPPNRWSDLAAAAIDRWIAAKQVELARGAKAKAKLVDDVADALSIAVSADALEELVVSHASVVELFASGEELMAAVRERERGD